MNIFNNRKLGNSTYIQIAPKYSQKEINNGISTIEKLRRARSMKLIKHTH